MMAKTTTPPTAIPTMAPVLSLLLPEFEGDDVPVLVGAEFPAAIVKTDVIGVLDPVPVGVTTIVVSIDEVIEGVLNVDVIVLTVPDELVVIVVVEVLLVDADPPNAKNCCNVYPNGVLLSAQFDDMVP